MELPAGNSTVESLWVTMKGLANKMDVIVGVCFWPHSQDDNTDELFFKELTDISRSVVLILMGDFNLTDVNREYHTADTNKSRRIS